MKILSLILLLIVSTNVFAEWAKVGDTEEFISYVDFGTIKKKSYKVKMWYLYDFKKVQHVGDDRYLSSVNHQEYDCEEETSRWLDFYEYSGNMKSGEIVFSNKNIKFEPVSIVPESIDYFLLKIACDKK